MQTLFLCLLFVIGAHAHITGLCVSRISDGSLQIAVEHWHGAAGVSSGSGYTVTQGAIVVTGTWQQALACGCPAPSCATSYYSCGASCVGTGAWSATIADPGFVYPGTITIEATNGGAVTASCGSCTSAGGGIAVVPLPPPASTCFEDICGDTVITGSEVCEPSIPIVCAPGYPPQTCNCCTSVAGTCCTAGTAVCQSHTATLSGGSATVSVPDVDGGSNVSANCPQSAYPFLTKTSFTCSDYPSSTTELVVGPDSAERCTATVTLQATPSVSCNAGPHTIISGSGTATFTHPSPTCSHPCTACNMVQTSGPAMGSTQGYGIYTTTWETSTAPTSACTVTVRIIGAHLETEALFMYITNVLDLEYYLPGDSQFSIDVMPEGSTVVEWSSSSLPASTTPVAEGIHSALAGYKDVRFTGWPSGVQSTSQHILLCPSPYTDGDCWQAWQNFA